MSNIIDKLETALEDLDFKYAAKINSECFGNLDGNEHPMHFLKDLLVELNLTMTLSAVINYEGRNNDN